MFLTCVCFSFFFCILGLFHQSVESWCHIWCVNSSPKQLIARKLNTTQRIRPRKKKTDLQTRVIVCIQITYLHASQSEEKTTYSNFISFLFLLLFLFCCPELLISSRDEPLLQLAQERSCWNDHHGDMSEAYHGGKLRCYVHIMDQGLCCRVNTLASYIEANRLVSQTLAFFNLNVDGMPVGGDCG